MDFTVALSIFAFSFVFWIMSVAFGGFRYAKDNFRGEDKLAHLFGTYFLVDVLHFFSPLAWLLAFVLGFAWEVKDGILDWEKIGYFGGDGFSWRDLVADCVGILLWVILHNMG